MTGRPTDPAGRDDAPDLPDGAAAALTDAARLGAAVHRGSRWYATYLAAYGIVFFGITFSLPYLDDSDHSIYFFLGAVGAATLLLGTYAATRRVTPRDYTSRLNRAFAHWALVYFPLAIFGALLAEGQLAYWIPAAVATAAPWFVHAWRVRARTVPRETREVQR